MSEPSVHMPTSRRTSMITVLLLAALTLSLTVASSSTALASNHEAASTIPSTSQELEIRIDSPTDGTVVDPAASPLTVEGVVGIDGLSTQANAYYMVDVSGSTTFPTGLDCDGSGDATGDDFNGDSLVGDVLDCEISGVLALNDSLSAGVSVGLGAFGTSAANADMDPGAATATFTEPPDADADSDGTADLEEVARSLVAGSIGQFTPFNVGGSTSYVAAIESINDAFSSVPGETNVAFMLSDGQAFFDPATDPGLAAAVAAGTVINTYAVGSAVSGQCAPTAGLGSIADATGGTCTEVVDPSTLSTALGGAAPAGIEDVEVALNGGAPVTATLDALGNWSADLDVSALGAGDHTIEATVTADDPDETEATAMVTVTVEAATAPAECVDLIAGKHIDVGEVCVSDDGTDMTVTYSTTDGWRLLETHLHVGDEVDDVPHTRKGNPIPGRFEHSDPHGATDTYSYVFPIPSSSDGEWVVAAHAAVEGFDTSKVLMAAGYWADGTDEVDQGQRNDGSDVLGERSDPGDALVADSQTADAFFSLGFGGSLVVELPCPVPNLAGDDLRIWEVTNATYPSETALVEAWDPHTDMWVELGTADNSGQAAGSRLTETDLDLGTVMYTDRLRITDTTDASLHDAAADGFDLDGVQSLQDCHPILEESAWGDGERFVRRGNWGMYFTYPTDVNGS